VNLSREHSCFSQHLNEKKPKRCRCRKRISLSDATKQVEKGFAQWLIVSQTLVDIKEICHVCTDKTKKGCQNCKGTGEVLKTYPLVIHGTDIVLVSSASANEDGSLVFRSVKALKTPRVATIEEEHITRAYVYNNKDEQERIEEYGLMTLQARTEMKIGIEPEDDPATGTGRKYDFGRTPFARISDERTSMGTVGKRILEGFKMSNGNSLKGLD
jgi:hypothetical protein